VFGIEKPALFEPSVFRKRRNGVRNKMFLKHFIIYQQKNSINQRKFIVSKFFFGVLSFLKGFPINTLFRGFNGFSLRRILRFKLKL